MFRPLRLLALLVLCLAVFSCQKSEEQGFTEPDFITIHLHNFEVVVRNNNVELDSHYKNIVAQAFAEALTTEATQWDVNRSGFSGIQLFDRDGAESPDILLTIYFYERQTELVITAQMINAINEQILAVSSEVIEFQDVARSDYLMDRSKALCREILETAIDNLHTTILPFKGPVSDENQEDTANMTEDENIPADGEGEEPK